GSSILPPRDRLSPERGRRNARHDESRKTHSEWSAPTKPALPREARRNELRDPLRVDHALPLEPSAGTPNQRRALVATQELAKTASRGGDVEVHRGGLKPRDRVEQARLRAILGAPSCLDPSAHERRQRRAPSDALGLEAARFGFRLGE